MSSASLEVFPKSSVISFPSDPELYCIHMLVQIFVYFEFAFIHIGVRSSIPDRMGDLGQD